MTFPRIWLRRVVTGLFLTACWAGAQTPLPQAAQAALAKGQAAASEALATYDVQYLDRPLWKEAIEYGETAQRAAPDRPEPYRFLGQVYTIVKWYSRAWDAWRVYLQLGGPVTVQTGRYITEVSDWLGNNSFENSDFAAALDYYDALLSVDPTREDVLARVAQSYLALEQPNEAEGFLEGLVRAHPDNADYAELFTQAREQLDYGVTASRVYREGLALAAAGNPADALAAFERAAETNSDFTAALAGAGRAAQNLGRPEAALAYWQRVVALEPQNGEARQAVTLARNQSLYGVAAFEAYQSGVALYTQGRVEAARQSFRSAVSSNSRYGDAWAWLGRIAVESGSLEDGVSFYDRARTLNPSDGTYTDAYQRAAQQLTVQQDAQQAAQEAERQAAEAAAAAERERLAQEEQARQEAAQAAEAAQQAEATAREAAAQEEAERAAAQPAPTPASTAPAAPETAPELAAAPPATSAVATPTATPTTTPVAPPTAPAPAAQSGQVKLLNVAYTHDSEAAGSGAYSFFGAPGTLSTSLTAPVDYANGTVYQRLEVLSKPTDTPVQYQLCLVPKDISTSPACSNTKLSFSGPGVYENNQPLSSFLNYNRVNWNSGIDNVMLVVKDAEGRPIDSSYFTQSGDDLKLDDYFPMNVRFEAVIVPPGASFQGW
ncbi:hypothetical protein BH24DEI2_BH24DEI2_24240 [soil metagenome]